MVFADLVFELAFKGVDGKKLEINGAAVAIVMADVGDALANGGLDSELFIQFPSKSLFRTFASLDLAAGKLPLQGHRLIGTSLAYQHFAVANEKPRGNEPQCRSGRLRVGVELCLFHTSSVNGEQRGKGDLNLEVSQLKEEDDVFSARRREQLFASDCRYHIVGSLRPEVAPAVRRGRLNQRRRWIHWKGVNSNLHHRQVMD